VPASAAALLLSLALAAVPVQAQKVDKPDVDKPDVDKPDVDEPDTNDVPDVQAPDTGLPGDPTQSPTGIPTAPGEGGGGGGSGSDPGDSSGESSDNRHRDSGEVFDETGTPQGRRGPLYLNPFPVVRIRGAVYGGMTRIDLVRALRPAGSRVYTRCHGPGCPFTRKASGFSTATGVVPFGSWRRQKLRAGAILEVFVTREGTIGKYTRLRIRSSRFPARYDGCVRSGEQRSMPCPTR
jgi:hypothetical protein